jgi:hypothetical protein
MTASPPQVIRDQNGEEMIPLTAAEIRRLINLYSRLTRTEQYHERWSNWRRHHQARARLFHYQRRIHNLKVRL